MNFSPFGSHFSTSIPNIHQFAAKLSQDICSPNSFSSSPEEISLTNRYTANGVPSFTQHHHASTQQQLLAASTKNNGNYLNQTVYHQNVTPKRQNFEQQNFDIFSVRGLQEKALINSEQKKKNEEAKIETNQFIHQNQQSLPNCQSSVLANPWQNLSASSSSVVDYLSQLPTTSLPISLHDFLKYSAETLKKDTVGQHGAVQQHNGEPNLNIGNNGTVNIDALHVGNSSNRTLNSNNNQALSTLSTINTAHLHNNNILKKKKKKKLEREKKPKPKPGEIRLTTALDGSTLYCCPECHMALPERDLLEQHLMGHNMERRFVCDICGAALKRKDHLTRHKQSHNPERPFVCSVCLKAFKRKEQLTLHFVIHSGEKRHICTECGKGFYRKDHLRKHTRSHIARRVKAELSQQGISTHSITS
ncbi:zinc finger protein 33B [Dendroctonus ponderosae]|uniref:C2H2-type domain-containing protein n=2 Tax=Dendroctonus ponderosae TaxID=77166 RepID=A0AAR5PXL5_DENPD|nr:zinc finger protein 33B [Dendroctonus ponderosae]KAH1015793.1 hypothetical protein HUJ04_007124 [Dendroctonus ponderosae]KAH1015797.1 hypothetical protein HUJ04_007124 [Dendroctonus ponderosae]KAH1025068.1 hypothetical protein HUJ05_009874 [Dendroctonus ponderosae]KAH1025069.1 hypothetical protein HUJ05_009874 [Dendroctonus ponderosae]KAH1025071.1 hypothetical protein HUJ05_009874 [Dendroctonus ponderosae]